jgi:phosphomannomutase
VTNSPVITGKLKQAVAAWIDADPDPADQERLADLLAAAKAGQPAAIAELTSAFAGPLEFGTAGLRGQIGPGPGRMNRAVVIRAAAGLTAYLMDGIVRTSATGQPAQPAQQTQPTQPVKVVIGYDARHGSAQFARDTAGVVVAAGGRAFLWQTDCPTPLLAYAVRQLKADAGVMVTASHNPASDNGYKIYLGGRMATGPGEGVQIVPPADSEIAARIAAAPPANQVRRAQRGWQLIGPDLEREYSRQAVAGVAPVPGAADLRIVHTAMHGVGGRIALPVLAEAGFTDVHSVPAQLQPDPDFPTVAFPNPEEPGAIDLANGLAERIGADLVIAQDPDADRCAVSVYDPRAPQGGGWRMLSGDELGALLGEEAARSWQDRPGVDGSVRPTLAASIVSSRLLGRIARHHRLVFQRTLTGFKWIARTPGLVFGYEEAIGFCTRPDLVRDKDGITAALAIARLAARSKLAGTSLIDLLDDLARRHGLHLTSQLAFRMADVSRLGETIRRLRRTAPEEIAGLPLTRTVDLAAGWEGLPPTDGLVFSLADSSRVIVRPSGTEPKVKCYLEVVLPVASTADFNALTAVRQEAADRLARLEQALTGLLS